MTLVRSPTVWTSRLQRLDTGVFWWRLGIDPPNWAIQRLTRVNRGRSPEVDRLGWCGSFDVDIVLGIEVDAVFVDIPRFYRVSGIEAGRELFGQFALPPGLDGSGLYSLRDGGAEGRGAAAGQEGDCHPLSLIEVPQVEVGGAVIPIILILLRSWNRCFQNRCHILLTEPYAKLHQHGCPKWTRPILFHPNEKMQVWILSGAFHQPSVAALQPPLDKQCTQRHAAGCASAPQRFVLG